MLMVTDPDQLPSASPVARPTCIIGTSEPAGPAAVNPLHVTVYVPATPAFVQAFGPPWACAVEANTIATITIIR
jgi:hypothetical protein